MGMIRRFRSWVSGAATTGHIPCMIATPGSWSEDESTPDTMLPDCLSSTYIWKISVKSGIRELRSKAMRAFAKAMLE